MPLNVSLNLLTERGHVSVNRFKRGETWYGAPWVALTVAARPAEMLSIITGDRLLLEQIAHEATELASWLKSEADTKLLPETNRSVP